jgi:hypothetical protein
LADLDGDGRWDLISGSYPGEIYWFRRKASGAFAKPVTLKRGAAPLNVGRAAAVAVADWDADGDPDLIIGTIDGKVWLVPNEGSKTRPKFRSRRRLKAGDATVAVSGDAGPCVADWDQDGKPDLLVGGAEGEVLWYRNVGTRTKPALAKPETLLPALRKKPPLPPKRSGLRVKPCVTDWNGDGRPDLLVGDLWFIPPPKPQAPRLHGFVWVYLRDEK